MRVHRLPERKDECTDGVSARVQIVTDYGGNSTHTPHTIHTHYAQTRTNTTYAAHAHNVPHQNEFWVGFFSALTLLVKFSEVLQLVG